MARFIVGFVVTLVVMMGLGWTFNQTLYSGVGSSEPGPAWLQYIGLVAWLLFNSGIGYVLVPALAGALWVWLGNSKGGRFSGVMRYSGVPTDGTGCTIYPRVSIGDSQIGTAVVPNELLEQWRYPGSGVSGYGSLDALKIGRCVVALNSARGFREAWGFGTTHKAFPFLSMAFFMLTVVSCGAALLVTYLPVYIWGAAKVSAFRRDTAPKPQLACVQQAD